MGGRGPTPPVRGRCREATEGVGWRSYGHEVPVGRVPRRRFGDFAAAGKVTRRPQAAKSPLQETKPLCHRPLIRHGFAVPPFPIPSVASRHLPLIRGVGPRGEGFFGGPHPAPLGPPLPQGEGLGGRPHRAAPAAETDLLERNGGNNPSPLFPAFQFPAFVLD